jgi:hypothetical protein
MNAPKGDNVDNWQCASGTLQRFSLYSSMSLPESACSSSLKQTTRCSPGGVPGSKLAPRQPGANAKRS